MPKGLDVGHIISAAPEQVHVTDDEGRTPLHPAFFREIDTRHIHGLIEAGADVFATLKMAGSTLLHLLFEQTWFITPDGQVKVGISFSREPSPAYGVVVIEFERHDNLLQYLLAMGLSVNTKDAKGETPVSKFFRHAEIPILQNERT